MSRNLLILRHAKSAWDTDASTDFERPLAKRGEAEAPRVGRWLSDKALVPDFVVSSPAVRAKQTAVSVCKELGIKKKAIHWDERIYMGDTEALLKVLGDCPKKVRTVMIVGHNPGLEELLLYLVGSKVKIPKDGKLLTTAGTAHLKMPNNWNKLGSGSAKVVSVNRPGR